MRAYSLPALLTILFSPALALAQSAPRTFADLANLFVVILNNATTVLIVAGIAVYFYGISTNILKFGEGEREKLKNYFVWGIIVLFVMVSIWGILGLLQTTLFGNTSFNATNGASQQPADQFGTPHFLE